MSRYTHRSAFKDYVKELEDKGSALTDRQHDLFFRALMKRIARKIIVDQYEWKLPFRLGYIRISKTKGGLFFWFWDRNNPYTSIPKKLLWSFRPTEDWVEKQIGRRGLIVHYFKCLNDPKIPKYDVPIIDHRLKIHH